MPARPETRVVVPPSLTGFLKRLGRAAAAQQVAAHVVGGCVRDWMLGRRGVLDVDVVIQGDGIAFARALAAHERCGVTAHQQFGTATLELPGGMRLDIATCRKETYAKPAAYPSVEPGTLRDDLFRRDFTINAMAIDVAPGRFGARIDPFHGARDVAARRLRILHPKSFEDDPTRMVRAARLAVRYGLTLEPSTRRALRAAMADGLLERVNRGRLKKELDLMLREPDPSACVDRLGSWLMQGRQN